MLIVAVAAALAWETAVTAATSTMPLATLIGSVTVMLKVPQRPTPA